ncbi:GNAT family N-acetyltransferase [Streptomyces aurantiogriseus]|uniref:N-acetyltransferase GCN5 n=1 Tax=Streptomyces aurantiogriseus TaxID=66870 RepID=A0A918CJS3_9ACTN|nr:GNAT family N-acetyltransferase [Streptomyces aurantiogriseus]GGR26772.1 N-acetyltransferase GCN5 [Streptomyces aurantiogriseus]
MAEYTARPLSGDTWADFARLVERHGGVFGGCWCMAFHAEGVGRSKTPAQNRAEKESHVREGRAHATLVYDGAECVGWCQFGPVAELPRIKHRRAYEAGLGEEGAGGGGAGLPDWRITCFFVDRAYRRRGVASAGLDGALREIARLGGGTVESYPEDVAGRSVSASFLHNGTVALFESRGFTRSRSLGKHHWVVARTVSAVDASGRPREAPPPRP